MKKLNGWQRLWVVAVVLWSMLVLAKAFNDAPRVEQERSFWRTSAELQSGIKVPYFEACHAPLVGEQPKNLYVSTMKCELAAAEGWDDAKARYELTVLRGEKDLQETVMRKQRIHYAIMAGVWLVPLIALYVAGRTVAWVSLGFRGTTT